MRTAYAILAAACGLSSCSAPDRYYAGASQGVGSIDGEYNDYDTQETRLEVGVSGDLGWGSSRTIRSDPAPSACDPVPSGPIRSDPAPSPEPAQEPASGIDWGALLQIVLVLAGAAVTMAGQAGHKALKARKAGKVGG